MKLSVSLVGYNNLIPEYVSIRVSCIYVIIFYFQLSLIVVFDSLRNLGSTDFVFARTRCGVNRVVETLCCFVGLHVVHWYRTRNPIPAEFLVWSVPCSVTRVSARRSVTGRFDDPAVGFEISRLRWSLLVISYFWWFSRIFRKCSGKSGNPGRPDRADGSPIFWGCFGCESRKVRVGKVAQNVVSDFL